MSSFALNSCFCAQSATTATTDDVTVNERRQDVNENRTDDILSRLAGSSARRETVFDMMERRARQRRCLFPSQPTRERPTELVEIRRPSSSIVLPADSDDSSDTNLRDMIRSSALNVGKDPPAISYSTSVASRLTPLETTDGHCSGLQPSSSDEAMDDTDSVVEARNEAERSFSRQHDIALDNTITQQARLIHTLRAQVAVLRGPD